MLRRLLAVGPLAAFAIACASPTLPLPPPMAPTVAPGTDADHVHLASPCGGVEGDAIVIVVNNSPAVPGDEAVSGALASDCGAWDANVFAHSGDVLRISQVVGTDGSQVITFQVP